MSGSSQDILLCEGQQRSDRERGTQWILERSPGAREKCGRRQDFNIVRSYSVIQDYDSSDLEDFAKTIMKGCDINRDGKVSKKVC